MLTLIIDKSYLQSKSFNALTDIAKKYKIIVPDILFEEIITTQNNNTMISCINKIKHVCHNVYFTTNIGSLIKFELEMKKPAKYDISCNTDSFRNWLNRYDPYKPLTQYQHTTINKSINEELESGAILKELHVCTHNAKNIKNPAKFASNIANNKEILSKMLKSSNIIPRVAIDKNWALYKHLQVHLYMTNYNKAKWGASPAIKNDIYAHTSSDCDYCIHASYNNAIGSRDKLVCSSVRNLFPKVIIEE